ncbi:SAM-dependent methyltransferase [Sphaerisporangium dianthi]|uniref:SAM-dependent methyltransferase n=1 Tax=Sphaerisporangium dianthi TaxID=1436120 RepID=A0ABV9CQ58_9ACTN
MDDERPPRELDVNRPNVARMYDYYLGGKNHLPADRAAAEKVIEISGGRVREAVRENRDFLGRAVRYLANEHGVRRFLDLGAGLPTKGNVHEAALAAAPDARVVYVDNDPVVAAHGRALLVTTPEVSFLEADLRRPGEIISALPEAFTLDRPVGLLMVACLHFVPDEEDPWGLVAAYARALPAGSHIVISHVSSDSLPEVMARGRDAYKDANASFEARTGESIRRLFDGLRVAAPGVVPLNEWRPDPDALPLRAEFLPVLGGVGQVVRTAPPAGLGDRTERI